MLKAKEIYLINEQVEFSSENNSLINIQTGAKRTLYTPATLCLQELILRKPEIVSQQELLICGWGDRSHAASPSSFYQAILMLRKALSDVGLNKDVVKTVNRRGLYIPDHVKIEEIENTKKITFAHPTLTQSPKEYQNLPPPRYTGKGGVKKPPFSLLFLTIILMTASFLYIYEISPHSYFNDYIYRFRETAPCSIYTNSDSITRQNKNPLLDKYGTACPKGGDVYLTTHLPTSNASIIYCKSSIDRDNPHCKSIFSARYYD